MWIVLNGYNMSPYIIVLIIIRVLFSKSSTSLGTIITRPFATGVAVNNMDSRGRIHFGQGFGIGTTLRPLLNSFIRIHVLLAYQTYSPQLICWLLRTVRKGFFESFFAGSLCLSGEHINGSPVVRRKVGST